jgi:hypothetical protein
MIYLCQLDKKKNPTINDDMRHGYIKLNQIIALLLLPGDEGCAHIRLFNLEERQ